MGLKRRKGERERFHIRGSTRKRMGVQGHHRENKKDGEKFHSSGFTRMEEGGISLPGAPQGW